MTTPAKRLRILLAFLILAQSTVPGAAQGGEILGRLKRLVRESSYHGTPPETGADCSMELLAENIDWLEHHIDTYGSIVAKQPDIWGEARLTKHRDEYERQMFGELGKFANTINASIRQSDVSFFAQAIALSAAAGQTAPPTLPQTVNPTDLAVSTADIAGAGAGAIGLEPVTVLDQMHRYINHLHELRRRNEGDDTSDSPGYALNLVRMPVSLLPGKLTRQGFGGEMTVTAEPVLTDDLLPTTFRNLVINDVVDQLGLSLVRTVEHQSEIRKKSEQVLVGREVLALLDRLEEAIATSNELFGDSCSSCQACNGAITNGVRLLDDAHCELPNPNVSDDVVNALRNALDYAGFGEALNQVITKVLPDVSLEGKKPTVSGATCELVGGNGCSGNACGGESGCGSDSDAPCCDSSDGCTPVEAVDGEPTPAAEGSLPPPPPAPASDPNASWSQRPIVRTVSSSTSYDPTDEIKPEEEDKGYGNLARRDDRWSANRIREMNFMADWEGLSGENGAASTWQSCVGPCTAKQLRCTQIFLAQYANPVCLEQKQQAFDGLKRLICGTQIIRNVMLQRLRSKLSTTSSESVGLISVVPSGRSRRATNPMNPSAVVKVIGIENMLTLAKFFDRAYYGRHVRWNGVGFEGNAPDPEKEQRVNVIDAQHYLRDETSAAADFFSDPEHIMLLVELANSSSGLSAAIRSSHLDDNDLRQKAGEISVEGYRKAFFESLHLHCDPGKIRKRAKEYTRGGYRPTYEELTKLSCNAPTNPAIQGLRPTRLTQARNPSEALAWAVVVESALLNTRLNDDIRKLARAKQEYQLDTGRAYDFFLPDSILRPNSGLEHLRLEFESASEVFQEYVRVRWPIHVFALDPAAQDQNVADASARRRELQFALALGFTSGQIGGNSLTQFSRELQTDVETISLNRTVVGFGHGSDTFGWRYYPRVQGLEAPGTLGALRETFLGTSRDYDLRHRRIEPGMRECVAIVLMPSFVPYVDFHIRSNWQKLTNPKNAALTMKDTLHLSRAITRMRNCRAQCVKCEHLYRPMELQRMLKRIHQLDQELPLQSTRVQVPYENTLGGFEMFNTGVTDLAPELIGWYGAPGVLISDTAWSCPSAPTGSGSGSGSSTSSINAACTSGCTNVSTTNTNTNNASTAAPAAAAAASSTTGATTSSTADCPAGGGTTLFLVGDNFSVHDTKLIAGGVCIPDVRLVSRDIMRVTIPSCVNTVNVDGKDYVAVYAATPYGVTNHLHIPVHTRSVSKDSKTAIDKAVETEVKKQITALKLPPSDMVIAPNDSNNKAIQLEAFCKNNDPSNLMLKLKAAPPALKYTVQNPSLVGVRHTLYGSLVKDGKPVVQMQPVIEDLVLQPSQVLGGDVVAAFLSTIGGDLASSLSYADLADDGKDDLSLVISIQPLVCHEDGCRFPAVPILDPIEIKVTLACPCCGGDSTTSGSSNGGSDQGSGSRTPACPGCGTVKTWEAPAPSVMPTAWETSASRPRPLPGVRVPAHFAQQVAPEAPLLVATPSDTVSFDELRQRLDRIEAAILGVRAADAPQPATSVAVPIPQPSTIEVQVISPPAAETPHNEWWDPKKHPIVTQTKTRVGERWRNLRDRLPRQ